MRFKRETAFRGPSTMAKLAAARVHVCGAGALGSNLALQLTRLGIGKLTIIDCDRVDESNIGTQCYSLEDVGGRKPEMLRNLLYRDSGCEADACCDRLTAANVGKLLNGASLVVDAFDNAESRAFVHDHCAARSIACLHVGLNDAYGEIRWNERYIVPSGIGEDACEYPLSRTLVMLVVAVAAECIVRYLDEGAKVDYEVTAGDLSITPVATLS